MATRQEAHAHLNNAGAKFAFTALIALSLLFAQSLLTQARADKLPKDYGRIKVSTNPGGFPILIDGEGGEKVTPALYTTTNDQIFNLPPGIHKVEIIFPNGETWMHEFNVKPGRVYCVGLAYAPKSIAIPPPPLPCPYQINVSGPSDVNDGESITFAAKVAYRGTSALNYTWTVSPASARIVSGAGTDTIIVDSTGLGRQRVQAILVVDDGSGERLCRQTAQASTNIIPPPDIKPNCYDCFPFTVFDDTKARLDNLAIELQNSPSSQGYIIAYAGKGSRAGQADRLITRAKDYLIQNRGIDPGRLAFINGGYRETDYFEFWIVPQGAQPPQPTPTVQGYVPPSDTQPGTNRRSRRPRRHY